VYIMCGRSDVKINYTLVSCDADSLAVNGDFQFAGMFSFLFLFWRVVLGAAGLLQRCGGNKMPAGFCVNARGWRACSLS